MGRHEHRHEHGYKPPNFHTTSTITFSVSMGFAHKQEHKLKHERRAIYGHEDTLEHKRCDERSALPPAAIIS
eukprot:1153905-Pelagomonas_calceolata.AAC.3